MHLISGIHRKRNDGNTLRTGILASRIVICVVFVLFFAGRMQKRRMPIIFRVSGHLLKYQMIIKDEERITLIINEYQGADE